VGSSLAKLALLRQQLVCFADLGRLHSLSRPHPSEVPGQDLLRLPDHLRLDPWRFRHAEHGLGVAEGAALEHLARRGDSLELPRRLRLRARGRSRGHNNLTHRDQGRDGAHCQDLEDHLLSARFRFLPT